MFRLTFVILFHLPTYIRIELLRGKKHVQIVETDYSKVDGRENELDARSAVRLDKYTFSRGFDQS